MAERKFVNLLTPFGDDVKALLRDGKADEVLSEYPRPILKRNSYMCLNGLWQYAIYPTSQGFMGWQGEILVPFSPEALLSGVGRVVTPSDTLYYKRTIVIAEEFLGERVFINFGAVDYLCTLTVNGQTIGSHTGGFYPFSFELSGVLTAGENTFELSVTDPSDSGVQSKGKQRLKASGIWYTPQSGIWQTVWLESTPANYVKDLTIVPDIDAGTVSVQVFADNAVGTVSVYDMDKCVVTGEIADGCAVITMPVGYKLWSPESPFLYDIIVDIGSEKISSYFGMRKYSLIPDDKGILRIGLNNKPYFMNGLLDQGYWSDGMLTPPSEQAMVYDIATMKDMGFNMLRKHIKLEPLRWYYHCDRLGMIVWQDAVNGGGKYNFMSIGALPFIGVKMDDSKYRYHARRDKAGRDEYYVDLERTMNTLKNIPSIAVWVPFNEGWGQFDSLRAVEFIRQRDTTRLVDHASGWHDHGGGDFNSLHIYFTAIKVPHDTKRAVVLSEFGGYSMKEEGHVFNLVKTFGYKKFDTRISLSNAYKRLFDEQIIPNIAQGLSATVYTQVSDVEDELNGLLTYDRRVEKIDRDFLREINSRVKL